jgi:hypothetical protein
VSGQLHGPAALSTENPLGGPQSRCERGGETFINVCLDVVEVKLFTVFLSSSSDISTFSVAYFPVGTGE